MMEQSTEGLPYPNARTLGVVYLLYFLTAFFAEFLMKGLVIPGDAAMTARNIMTHDALYRSGFAVGLIANVIYIAITALFYRLLGPVNRLLALLAVFCSLVGCATQIFAGLFQLAPFLILRDNQLSNVFTVQQLQALALLSLKLYAEIFHISFVLFAFFDLMLGYLISRSTFLPKILGVLLMIAGLGWLTFLWPPLSTSLSSFVLPIGALAEILLMLWLLVKGVNVQRWHEKVQEL